VTIDGKRLKLKGLRLKQGHTAEQGYKEILEHPERFKLDCASFQSVVSRLALLDVLGNRLFNEKYKNVGIAGLHVDDDPFPFNKTRDPVPGCAVLWQFPEGMGGAFNKENTILVAPGTYGGHPIGSGKTADEIRKILEEKGRARGVRPMFPSDIEFTRLPKRP
jgi:hypothetical protein